MSVLFLTFSCYDDSYIRDELRNHEERLAKLETLCKQMNTNISALQTIVSTLQKNVYVTAVTPIKEGSDIVGYAISFSNSESVTIYHGRDGADGKDGTDGVNGASPSIGVRQDTDGIYYWTLNGEWLLDAAGKKVQAVGRDGSDGAAGEDGTAGSNGADGKDGEDGENGQDGKDGKTPQLKIEGGYWYVSYDGQTWTQLGKATGDSANLIGVTQDDKNVYFTLTDGTVITIPKGNGGSQDDEDGGNDDGSQTISKGPITLSLGDVTDTTVSFTARLDVDMMADYQEVGLVYSTDDDLSLAYGNVKKVHIADARFSKTIDVDYNTTYYYTVYLYKNGVYLYGDKQVFTTLPFNGTELSAKASANCYIVSSSGNYSFGIVKGNSGEAIEKVETIVVLWESFGTDVVPNKGDLIKHVNLTGNHAVFHTADDFKEGNAVIAAKDAEGNILWSWHIWLTDEPQGQVYYNNAGTMMDRNLGATSATPGDVGALGLLYQWGRKDPFLGSSSISSNREAYSTINWPSAVSSDASNGTIAYATSHPTTFITSNSKNNDWYYNESESTDNTRWTTSSSAKSIYDPCPVGWRVPDGGSTGVWSKACGSYSSFSGYPYNKTNKGMNLSGKFGEASTIWYPASGFRYYGERFGGSLSGVGDSGLCWSASPTSLSAFCSSFDKDGDVYPSESSIRASGRSVRCIQE